MKRTEIAQLHQSYAAMDGQTVTVAGWIKTSRDSKAVAFLSLSDGSSFTPVQVVMKFHFWTLPYHFVCNHEIIIIQTSIKY